MGWPVLTLSEICSSVFAGGDVPKDRLSKFRTAEFTVPIYSNGEKNKGLYGFTDIARVTEPSITVSARGTIGYSEVRFEPFLPVVRLIVLTPNLELVELEYLKYVIQSMDFKNSGSSIPQLTVPMIKNYSCEIPPISEQKCIVAILDQAFADIEQARAKTEQNLKNARELFESYLQQVFSQRGDGWVVSKLVDVAKVIDSLHKTPKYTEEGFPMVRVTDVRPGPLDLSNTRKVDKDTYEEFSKKYKAKIGDIVFSRVGSYGRSSIVTTNEEFCLGQNTVFLSPSMDGYYFYYFLNSRYSKDQIDKLVSGSTQPTVSLKSIKEVEVPIPPKTEQLAIVKKLDVMHLETSRVERIYMSKLEKLDELKKSILQKAFSGELTKEKEGAVA